MIGLKLPVKTGSLTKIGKLICYAVNLVSLLATVHPSTTPGHQALVTNEIMQCHSSSVAGKRTQFGTNHLHKLAFIDLNLQVTARRRPLADETS